MKVALLIPALLALTAPGGAQSYDPAKPSMGFHCESAKGEPSLSFDFLVFLSGLRVTSENFKRVEFRNVQAEGVAISKVDSESGDLTNLMPPPGLIAFLNLNATALDPNSKAKVQLSSFISVRAPAEGESLGDDNIKEHGLLTVSLGTQKHTITHDCVSIRGKLLS